MLWVLKRTVSMRQFFWAPKTYAKIMGKKIWAVSGLMGAFYSICWLGVSTILESEKTVTMIGKQIIKQP